TERNYRTADEKLTAAANQTRPQEELALQIAEQLAPQTSQPIVLVKRTFSTKEDREFVSMKSVPPITVAALSTNESAAHFMASHGGAVVLEIHVQSAALTGKDRINPLLSFCVDAEATLKRTQDGQPLYSCPVRYRGVARRFTEWAAN